MKEVNLYARGNTYKGREGEEGQFILVMEDKGVSKEFYQSSEEPGVTVVRMLILGLTYGLKELQEPCQVNFHSHMPIGLGKIRNKKGHYTKDPIDSPNKDLLEELKKVILAGQHEVKEIISREKQEEFIRQLKNYRVK